MLPPHDEQWPEGCSCCWVMGFGVDESAPDTFAKRLFERDEECEHHGGDSGGS